MTDQKLVVDLSSNTGALKHGASGFLYGLGNDGIPSINMLAPLKPQVAAQKPEGGLQHPNGDALNVADTYKAAGGKEIEIYIQDIYPNWPYDSLGLEDYLGKVEQVVRQVAVSPNRSSFSYVPFNEPDQIWYNKGDKKQTFLEDWKTVYQKIKSIDTAARIVGPNLTAYDSGFFWDFMVFTSQWNCLPDVISWHELNNEFFGGWYSRYEDFRCIEASLGLPAREICINEYCRMTGDLGIPGQLVQWIARFENSKVDACLAYWTDAGSLNNLVARDNYNQATGAWWLYRWYGGMTGDTLRVTPPDPNAEGLQGLAALDKAKKQARIILGGYAGDVQIVVTGFESAPYFGNEVHAAVWITEQTGRNPTKGPTLAMDKNFAVTDGQIIIPVNVVNTAAYQVILTPFKARHLPTNPHYYPAEYADLSGSASINYASPTVGAYVNGYNSSSACTTFVVTAQKNSFYEIKLNYAAGPINSKYTVRTIRLALNGSQLADVSIPATADWDAWADWRINLFLTTGINQIAFEVFTGNGWDAIHLRSIELTPGSGWTCSYEAEATQNTLRGTAAIMDDPAASGGKYVGALGNGEANSLEFGDIIVPQNGSYLMMVYFANADFRGGHSYNSQIVDRHADIRINGGRPQRVYFRNTFAWDNYQSRIVHVILLAGSNTIQFFNSDTEAYAPHIDKIEIATPFSVSS
jgi:hypothetical protein